ncbi:MAG: hypothetical protein L6R42_008750 [Xanthoria sp. 1 TBL-2021]|nr:MAG: hypothetical protein L6R42_008750 [Xanthoria sp. 1 TBL-2021]
MSQCTACGKPLTLEIDLDEEDEYDQDATASGTEVPDSVELSQCLLDAYEMIQCPKCAKDVSSHTSSGEEQVLCSLNNEGGLQQAFDILPILKEESYLKAFPEERRCRAFLEFCAEGDVGAILDLVNAEEDEDVSMNSNEGVAAKSSDVLRYRDPMGSLSTGLHVAVSNGREEIVWLLLFLASSLELHYFPADVLEAARTLSATREEQTGKVDIRVLEDSNHRTAENLAQQIGGMWEPWIQSERLRPIMDGVLPIV